ncbi:MAG: pilus assembly protein TadG-related protein [Pseudomonadota bacterium]
MKKLCRRIQRLGDAMVRDDHGNIAMMFGLLLFVILGAAGLAIDFTRSTMVRSEIHEAADAGVLAAARYRATHPNATDAELASVARKVFDNGLKDRPNLAIDSFSVTFDDASDTFALDVGGSMSTLFMNVLGMSATDVGARSEVKLGKPPLLEIAMALDVTGSMNQNGKISALRNAAKDLVATLLEADDADVKIGIVPFAQYVNVDDANGAQSWLSNPGGAWKGCVGSRDYPLNTKDSEYSAFPVPGINGITCPDALIPLTNDEAALDSMIGKLDANGWTYIPAGLLWAWTLLTPDVPFDGALSFPELAERNGTKAIILMTDGENTKAPDYPTHNGTDQTYADQLTKELCVNIKDSEIVIYAIAFDVSDANTQEILETCASSPSHYYAADDAGELSDVFASIASSLRNISLSK